MSIVGSGSQSIPRVSVIIPLHRDNEVFRACLSKLIHLECVVPFEVWLVSDVAVDDLPMEVRHVRTGATTDTSPAVKRDRGAKEARGELLAFIDDDAYPRSDWLDRACSALDDLKVDAVGGPGVTPPGSPWRQRLGGAVYESFLGSGPLRHRFMEVGVARDSDDLPAYNFVVDRRALEVVGGWASTFYGGEDTKVCLELSRAGFGLRHDPSVVVFHFRRPVLVPHCRQVANVGRHRGHFVRRYPHTSRRPLYFLPAIMAIAAGPAAAVALLAIRRSPRQAIRLMSVGWFMIAITAAKRTGPAAIAFPGVLVCHHLAYGTSFIRGFLGPKIET
jgi:GT2 family glycosyltransferase